jgi:DNA-dependent RNA polymerase auxiliary subunit epsilon
MKKLLTFYIIEKVTFDNGVRREKKMMYKVYYQESKYEVPVREKTQTIFLEANSEREARKILKDRQINIEFVQLVKGPYLDYEKQQEYFKITETR